jgi:hypothetical protein
VRPCRRPDGAGLTGSGSWRALFLGAAIAISIAISAPIIRARSSTGGVPRALGARPRTEPLAVLPTGRGHRPAITMRPCLAAPGRPCLGEPKMVSITRSTTARQNVAGDFVDRRLGSVVRLEPGDMESSVRVENFAAPAAYRAERSKLVFGRVPATRARTKVVPGLRAPHTAYCELPDGDP